MMVTPSSATPAIAKARDLTLESKVKELYANPVGHDAVGQLLRQLKLSSKLVSNPLVGNLRLKTIAWLTRKQLKPEFFDAFLQLLNTEHEQPRKASPETPIEKQWWKEAVFYQIYPRSFKDSNGDGIGDLGGIISKLDYLKSLGVDALWLSPIYDSPNDDNGYDIRDYYQIMHEFGTMEDFDLLLAGVHERGMRLIMDLVVNHTSDEHPWFVEATSDSDSKYRDYYFFRPVDGVHPDDPPNNWLSFFSGSAWNKHARGATGQEDWALHLFSGKQMDLNWDNPDVRADVAGMVNWWLDKGVDGFRMDVINYISKREGLPDGDETIHEIMGYRGIEHYFYGPRLNEYLHELRERTFEPHHAFCVGETPGVGMEMSKLLTGDYRKELDMVFCFDQLETPGHTRFDDYRYDLNYLKQFLMQWQNDYPNYCWMSLFYENHDNPRMVSKVNPDPAFREVLAKLLGAIQLTLKGTPFIFQGQEIGMVNQKFHSIDDMRDVESINLYHELLDGTDGEPGIGESEAFAKVLAGSRDHARTPVQWDAEPFGGFSDSPVTPWIVGDDDYLTCNVADELADPGSVLSFYQKTIGLRHDFSSALVYGSVEFIGAKEKDYFAYYRTDGDNVFFIECNLSEHSLNRNVRMPRISGDFGLVLSNYCDSAEAVPHAVSSDVLRPYEVRIFQRNHLH